jgi:formylglycine-generating enzyme required for sulfatase activity
VLTDFGLVHDDSVSMHTRTGEFLGTAAFAAPEQLRGDHAAVGAWTDVYGLGVTLYAALAGQTPFASTSTAGMLRRIEEGAGTPLAKVNPKVPRDLATILAKAIDRDPARRYRTASELGDDLARFLAFEPIAAQPAGLALRLQRWLERSPQLALALAALLVTLVAGLGVAIWLALDLAEQRSAARVAEGQAKARQRDFNQVAGVVLYDRAVATERQLHPPWPAQIAALESWLRGDAGRLLAMRPGLAQTLRELQARAASPDTAELAANSDQFLRDTLQDLDRKLERLAARECAAVTRRLRWAKQIGALTAQHPRARVSWAEARAALRAADGVRAHRAYAGQPLELRDADVLGLVPIGMNPRTLLWEFYDLRSAWDGASDPAALPIPAHAVRDGDAGHIAVGDDTGIVLVLVPGGRFVLGAQASDPAAPNYDPAAAANERPHELTLAPLFVARHELTQGQWRRLTDGDTPSHYAAGSGDKLGGVITWAHPVEQVDWTAAATLLAQHGMALPTEAQWEFAARGGTTTPWWCGTERESLRGVANLGDQAAKRAGAAWGEIADWPEFDDGYPAHAPVDALRANPFGLHHVHGNVFEWCADRYGSYDLPARAGDGLREVPLEVTARVPRGGSLTNAARGLRVALRREYTPTLRYLGLGLRAARPCVQR